MLSKLFTMRMLCPEIAPAEAEVNVIARLPLLAAGGDRAKVRRPLRRRRSVAQSVRLAPPTVSLDRPAQARVRPRRRHYRFDNYAWLARQRECCQSSLWRRSFEPLATLP